MKPTLLLAVLVLVTGSLNQSVRADHPLKPADPICQYAEEVRCAAENMKDEIKTHFRGAKGYGRMLSTNAILKSRASAIHRRVNRSSCYRRLEKDAAKLSELACELQQRFEEVINCSTFRRPVYGELGHVQAQIDSIRNLADCIRAEACLRLGKAVPVELRTFVLDPAIVQPSIPQYDFAPGAPIVEPLQLAPAIEPIIPQRSFKSVLEGNEPIILPPDRR